MRPKVRVRKREGMRLVGGVKIYSSAKKPLAITSALETDALYYKYTITHLPTGCQINRAGRQTLREARDLLRRLLPLTDWASIQAFPIKPTEFPSLYSDVCAEVDR